MTMIEEESFACPVCGEVFEDAIVISTNQMGQHTDFMPVVMGLFPFPYYIHACPKCGFAGFEEGFSAAYQQAFKDWVTTKLKQELESAELYGALKYVLAARCAHKLGKPAREVADLYLRGAWCAVVEEMPELEARCRKEAVERFEKALAEGGVPAEERAPITYLVGELHRRLGDTQTAHKWFDRAPGEITDPEEQAWVEKMAQMQKTNPVETFPEDIS